MGFETQKKTTNKKKKKSRPVQSPAKSEFRMSYAASAFLARQLFCKLWVAEDELEAVSAGGAGGAEVEFLVLDQPRGVAFEVAMVLALENHAGLQVVH